MLKTPQNRKLARLFYSHRVPVVLMPEGHTSSIIVTLPGVASIRSFFSLSDFLHAWPNSLPRAYLVGLIRMLAACTSE